MSLKKTCVETSSEGIQCELGCESYRNCLVDIKEECSSMSDDHSSIGASNSSAYVSATHENGEFDSNVDVKPIIHQPNQQRVNSIQYVCGFCGETFLVAEAFEAHCFENHPGKTPFKCHHCGKLCQAWVGRKGLEVHLKTSCAAICDSPFQCFRVSDNCKSNVSTIDNFIDFCELVCGDCGLQFSEPAVYDNHCRSHNIRNPFKCIECVMRFKKLLHLEEHKASHLLVNPYQCTDCGKEFSFKWALLMHSKEHGNSNDVVCCLCGELFLNQDYMAGHKSLVHSDFVAINVKECETHPGQFIPCSQCQEEKGDKFDENYPSLPLVCEECGVQFLCEEEFHGHLQCHETPQPFKCEECDKAYGSYLGLREHVSSCHSDVEVNWCEGCSGTGYIHVSLRGECEGSDEELHNVEVEVIQEMVEIDDEEEEEEEEEEEDDSVSCNYIAPSKKMKSSPEALPKSSKRKSQKDSGKTKQGSQNSSKHVKARTADKEKLRKKMTCKGRSESKPEKVQKAKRDTKTRRQGKKKGF